MIPVTKVVLGSEEEALVLEVLRSGQLAQGRLVAQFEQRFAEIHGVRHAIAVNNGTTALVVAMEALRVGAGDEVITSPFTFVATLNAILEAGATARFADIGDDFNLVPELSAELVTERTRAVMPVHLYGYMADMAAFESMAREHDLQLVEDAAQAVGATYFGRHAGSFGVGCFSLYATKNLTTGEGGVVTTDDDDVADRVRVLRNQGMRQRYQYEVAGHNYRLTDLAAAVGLPQLDRLATVNAARQRNAGVLRDGLAGIPGLALPPAPAAERSHVYHQFTVRIGADATVSRDDFVAQLQQRGVGSGIYYPRAVFDYDCYREHPRVVVAHVPNARRMAAEVVSLPVHPYLSTAELDAVISAVRAVLSA